MRERGRGRGRESEREREREREVQRDRESERARERERYADTGWLNNKSDTYFVSSVDLLRVGLLECSKYLIKNTPFSFLSERKQSCRAVASVGRWRRRFGGVRRLR